MLWNIHRILKALVLYKAHIPFVLHVGHLILSSAHGSQNVCPHGIRTVGG